MKGEIPTSLDSHNDPFGVISPTPQAKLSHDSLESVFGDHEDEDTELEFPGFIDTAFFCVTQKNRLRRSCLSTITSPWFERLVIFVILLNCLTLGMYQPCLDADGCSTTRCYVLGVFDHVIYAFFLIEMTVKVIAMGFWGKKAYCDEAWNRLDFFIIVAGAAEYGLGSDGNINLSAIRTIRVLRPLRAINRIPNLRILVMLLLDTMPMLANVLLICFFVFFIFGILGVQLWAGMLRQRCFMTADMEQLLENVTQQFNISNPVKKYYKGEWSNLEFICSKPTELGMLTCKDIPILVKGEFQCGLSFSPSTYDYILSNFTPPDNYSCINWNQYYTECREGGPNPFGEAISFDNIASAWIAIFQVISLEGWVDIMYYMQDAHSYWVWVYFLALIVIGAFFMVNLFLVVIATQFSETKRRETEKIAEERKRYKSSTTLTSTETEAEGCYNQLLKYIIHVIKKNLRKLKIHFQEWRRVGKNQNQGELDAKNIELNIFADHIHCQPCTHMMAVVERRNIPLASPEISDIESGLHQSTHQSIRRLSHKLSRRSSRSSEPSVIRIRRQSPAGSITEHTISAKSSSKHINTAGLQVIVDASYCHNNTALITILPNHPRLQATRSLGSKPTSTSPRRPLHSSQRLSRIETSRLTPPCNGNVLRRTRSNDTRPHRSGLLTVPNRALDPVKLSQQPHLKGDPYLQSDQSSSKANHCEDTKLLKPRTHLSPEIYATGIPLSRHSSSSTLHKSSRNSTHVTPDRDSDRQSFSLLSYMGGECDMNCAVCQHHCENHKLEEALDQKEMSICTKIQVKISNFRRRVKHHVDGKLFRFGVLAAILINTVMMGIEHHDQPAQLTHFTEVSNFVFIGIFTLEMILKLTADGFLVYIKDSLCVFDGFIVIMSYVELGMGAENSGLSVLRTFRLLRILKLIRFLPALQRQFLVMVKTLDNVASFFGLLMLFMFIFSVLGMNLFGCLFFELDEDGERVASRRNFDSLLWSMITVFQVLTQEDWNLIMYEGMKFTTPWAALYFIALMTIGNYVLFNLLVAILVEGFSSVAQDLLVKKILTELEQSRYLLELPCDLCGEAPTCVGPLAINANLQRIESIKIESDMGDQQLKDGSEEGSDACNRYSVTDGQELGPLITRTDATPHGSLRSDLSRLLPTPRFTIDEPKISDNTNSHIEEWNPFVNLSKSDRDKSSACSVSSGRSRRSSKSAHSDERVRMLEDQDDHRDEEKPSLSTNSNSNYSSLKNLNLPLLFQCASSENLSTPICASPKKSNGGPVHLETKDNKEADSNGGVRKAEEHTPLIDGSDEGKKNDEQSQVKSRQRKNILFKQDTVKEMTPKKKPGGVKQEHQFEDHEKMFPYSDMQRAETQSPSIKKRSLYQKICHIFRPRGCFRTRADYSFYIFSPTNPVRVFCTSITTKKWFDYSVLVLIGLNCIALAVERPSIPPDSLERTILTYANYGFTLLFLLEMILKVITHGLVMGSNSYLRNGWNVNDGFLVAVSVVDLIISWWSALSRPKIFGVLRVLRLLRALRPLRVISRAPGLKLVVETLLSSLRPIGNIVLICITFFLIFGILGVQLFKGTFWHCVGEHIKNITTKAGCQANPANQWVNEKYNFDHLGSALMSLFVLSSKDGWVMIMYTGLDAVGVDKQPIQNHSEWRLLYFISFLLLVGFFVLNMFVGVVVENFHRCREVHEKQERERKEQKRLKKLARKIAKRDLAQGLTLGIQAMGVTNGVTETPSYNVNEDYKDSEETVEMNEPPYWMSYGPSRYKLYQLVVNKYFDISVAIIIFLNVISMAVEHYNMSEEMEFALKMLNYVFTFIFILEALLKVVALGFLRYIRERWNQLDVLIVFLSILGIVMEEIETGAMPINPTIIRVMRILRIARVLKLLKMATGIRALLDTVLVALPQVGNLGLLFFLLFFIFAALGVELFGKIECSNANPCEGMGIHANFENSGAAFLTLFRIATGDNWNGIMKDALREDCDKSEECVRNCCVNRVVTPIYFVVFVLTAQFVLVNVVVAVLMKHLEDANFSVEDILYERRIDVTGTEGQHLLHQLALTQSARNLSTLVEPAETLRQIHYSDTVPDRLNKERSPHIMDQNGRAIHGSRRAHRRQNSLPNNFKLSSFYDDT